MNVHFGFGSNCKQNVLVMWIMSLLVYESLMHVVSQGIIRGCLVIYGYLVYGYFMNANFSYGYFDCIFEFFFAFLGSSMYKERIVLLIENNIDFTKMSHKTDA